MQNEYQILSHLQENEQTTQRCISSSTGLSLGAVNLLLKKMVRKGLIKVEKLNTRTVRYILTPQGMQEKARLTYRYIKQSYKQLLKINLALETLLANHQNEQPVLLFGPQDEICEILSQHLKSLKIPYTTNTDFNSFTEHKGNNNVLVITWREEEEEALSLNSRTVNIMKML